MYSTIIEAGGIVHRVQLPHAVDHPNSELMVIINCIFAFLLFTVVAVAVTITTVPGTKIIELPHLFIL